MSSEMLLSMELSKSQFNEISDMIKSICGIDLHEGKEELVKARLIKLIRKLRLGSFEEYLNYARKDPSGTAVTGMLDAISTNQTSFFREKDHFEYLAKTVLPHAVAPEVGKKPRLRIWSAGCSSGEEPYSIAITMHQSIPNLISCDAQILATDISTRILARAKKGVYKAKCLETVPPQLRYKYFNYTGLRDKRLYHVNDALRNLVHFARLNLMDSWPMRGPFDVIFCRNVMIYFDKPTQGWLVGRFRDLLGADGTLFLGHSESLTGICHQFKYVQPTVYKKA